MGSCDDMTDAPVYSENEVIAPEAGTAEIYVLNEGLLNLNNSTLMRYSFSNGIQTPDYFKKINKRGLGDTANDMAIYGSKLYVVVNVSSQIEVIDLKTGTS